MYSADKQDKFVELRAEGLTLDAISEQIGVPKPTLGRWNQECLEQIQRLRAIQWDLLEDQMGQRFEDSLKRIAQRIRRLEDELDTRKPQNYTRGELVRVIRQSRLEYLKLRSILMAPLQPTRGRIPCLNSLDPAKRDKTRQNTELLDTTPLPPNDLQPAETPLSHSVTPGGTSSVESQISRPSTHPDPSSADAGHNSPPANGGRATCPHGADSEISNVIRSEIPSIPPSAPPRLCGLAGPEHDDPYFYMESTVINPEECMQPVAMKCLEAQAAYDRARRRST